MSLVGSQTSLGEGTADFPELLGALDQYGYQGYFTVTHRAAADPEREIAQAIAYLRGF